jgi:hypothetical protein
VAVPPRLAVVVTGVRWAFDRPTLFAVEVLAWDWAWDRPNPSVPGRTRTAVARPGQGTTGRPVVTAAAVADRAWAGPRAGFELAESVVGFDPLDLSEFATVCRAVRRAGGPGEPVIDWLLDRAPVPIREIIEWAV